MAINSSAFQLSTISGPALGGVLFLLGERVVYGASVALLLAAVLLAARVVAPRMPQSARASLEETLAGLRFS